MTDSERIAALEAQILAQQALLTAFAWKILKPDEPLSSICHKNYADLAKQLNTATPPQSELATDLGIAVKALLNRLPRGV